MTNLDSVLKRRDITLLKKVCIVKVVVFPVVVYGCKSWTIQKAECWRTDAFKLWYWRRLFIISWTARRSNEWILNQLWVFIEYSVKLKLQYFGHLMRRANSLEKTPMLGKIEGKRRRREWQRIRRLDGIMDSIDIVEHTGRWVAKSWT